MLQPTNHSLSSAELYAAAAAGNSVHHSVHHHAGHHIHHSGIVDLHLPQGYPFYPHNRKGGLEDFAGNQGSGLHTGILEMRKEKSRDAARSRRGKENFEFYELAKMLPLPPAITSQLDKASIIRLTISYLKLREFSSNGDPPWNKDLGAVSGKNIKGNSRSRAPQSLHMELFETHQGTQILQSLDGFTFCLGSDGRFLYISETVSIYLGLSQVELTGSSMFDYVHSADHSELAEQLGLTLSGQGHSSNQGQGHMPASPASGAGSVEDGQSTMNPDVTSLMSFESNSLYDGLDRSFCIRMKSTLTKRGCHFKSSGYRVVMVLCRLRAQSQFTSSKSGQQSQQQPQQQQQQPLLGMVAVAIALPPPTIHEVRLEPDMFVTRLSFDLRIVHCEPRVSELLDFSADDLTGRSLYTLCHPEDIRLLRKAHTDIMRKGQIMTPYYRVLNRHGGFTWVQSCASMICNSKSGDEQSIIFVNYVLSRTEMGGSVMDLCQLESGSPGLAVKSSGFKTDSQGVDYPDKSQTPADVSGNHCEESQRTQPEISDSARETPNSLETGKDESHNAVRRTRGSKRKYEESNTANNSMEQISMEQTASGNAGNVNEESEERTGVSGVNCGSDDNESSALRWKRLYSGGAMDGDNIQERELDGSVLTSSTTDFSTDALLSKQQRSTIQWSGAQPQSSAAAVLSASLLRQLYASRESVIRSNVHANRSSGYFGDNSLPTPPGNNSVDGSGAYGPPHDAFPTTSTYPGASGFLPEYLPAMTPPSSVSPRDGGALFAEASLRHQYSLAEVGASSAAYAGAPAQPLPLKPHVYSHLDPAAASAAQYAQLTDAVGQFYPHGSSSFHLYHPQMTKAPPPPNGASAWYPN